jgi:hypothetical protein
MEWDVKMLNFVINIKPQKSPREMYVIHNFTAGCEWLPGQDNSHQLGGFENAEDALVKARKMFIYPQICHVCCGTAIPIMKSRSSLISLTAKPA